MVAENIHVMHKAFGEGTVISTNGQYFTVQFGGAKKTFVYPDIFEKFLTLADGSVSEDIKNDLLTTNAAKQRVIDKKREENVRAMTRGIVIPGKENLSPDTDEESSSKNNDTEEI